MFSLLDYPEILPWILSFVKGFFSFFLRFSE